MVRTTRVVVVLTSLIGGLVASAAGLAPPATAAIGDPGSGPSDAPAVSGDGRFIAFVSSAADLLGDDPSLDTNGVADVFLLDTQTGTIELISRDPQTGTQGNGPSDEVALSNDGRYVAFVTEATNLLTDDANGAASDVLLLDRETDTLSLVSRRGSTGAQGNSASYDVSITRDGTKVAFTSAATNLVGNDTNGSADAFVRDLVTQTTERVSTGSTGKQANGSTFSTGISGNGSFVGFDSSASTLVTGDRNGARDVFLKNLSTGKTIRVSVTNKEAEANSGSYFSGLSTTGRFIAFVSDATNLSGTDANRASDVFVRDKTDQTTKRVSRNGATEANASSGGAAISGDGAFVAFTTSATNLGDAPDGNGAASDLFEYEMATGTLRLVAVDGGGGWPNGASFAPAYGPSSVLAFASIASDLVGDDVNATTDVFTRTWASGREGGVTTLVSRRSTPA
jgi:Tol biopolymer transport system component